MWDPPPLKGASFPKHPPQSYSSMCVNCRCGFLTFFRPKIVTEDGHLIFRNALKRNITFSTSEGGGYVNINGEDLGAVVAMVSDNKSKNNN